MQRKLLIFLMLPLFLASCSKQIYSDKADGVNFNKFQTYAWIKPTEEESIPAKNFRYYADQEMAKRGFKLDSQNPDLLLEYQLKVKDKKTMVSDPVYSYAPFGFSPWGYRGPYWGGSYIAGYRTRPVYYKEGTAVIDVRDRNNGGQLIWRGWGVEQLNYSGFSSKDLNKMVKQIFKKYPQQPSK